MSVELTAEFTTCDLCHVEDVVVIEASCDYTMRRMRTPAICEDCVSSISRTVDDNNRA